MFTEIFYKRTYISVFIADFEQNLYKRLTIYKLMNLFDLSGATRFGLLRAK